MITENLTINALQSSKTFKRIEIETINALQSSKTFKRIEIEKQN